MSTVPRRLDPVWRRARRHAPALPPAPAGPAGVAAPAGPARPTGLAWLAAAAALTAVVVLAQLAPARAAASELPLHLRAATGGARLELPSGELVSLALPPGARLDAAAPLAGGWIAAGTAPIAGAVGGTAGTAGAAGDGRELLLLAGGMAGGAGGAGAPGGQAGGRHAAAAAASRTVTLPPPAGRIGKLLAEPLPLVAGGRLAGLAWLEGNDPRALGVRYATWNGAGWSAPRTVSAPGQGSQVALAACRLADGSWLLAWSAFDGTADEIVWSQRTGASWLPVRRLSEPNRVPDITPALTATAGGGALIAWSRYDGQGYQLRMARFEHGEWANEHVAGPSGSLYPAFLGTADRPRLLYLEAAARSWSVLDMDAAGKVLARASVSSPQRSLSGRRRNGARGRVACIRGSEARRSGIAVVSRASIQTRSAR